MGEFVAKLIAAGLLILGCLIYFEWGGIVRVTADSYENDVALWVWATDAAPGEIMEARARVDGGERASISGVTIEALGKVQHIGGDDNSWGETIETKGVDSAAATHDFRFRVPAAAEPGTTVELTFRVHATEARMYGMSGYTNDDTGETFVIPIDVYTPTMSVVRRIGRGAAAIASWFAVIAGIVLVRSRYARAKRTPSQMWWLLSLPYAGLAYLWFYKQLSAALRFHGWFLAIACGVVWIAALAVAARIVKFRYLPRYTVEPVGAAAVPVFELEAAWSGAGYTCFRRKQFLEIKMRTGTVIVPVPASESFGDAPFEVRGHDKNEVIDVVEVAGKRIGKLTCAALREAPFPFGS